MLVQSAISIYRFLELSCFFHFYDCTRLTFIRIPGTRRDTAGVTWKCFCSTLSGAVWRRDPKSSTHLHSGDGTRCSDLINQPGFSWWESLKFCKLKHVSNAMGSALEYFNVFVRRERIHSMTISRSVCIRGLVRRKTKRNRERAQDGFVHRRVRDTCTRDRERIVQRRYTEKYWKTNNREYMESNARRAQSALSCTGGVYDKWTCTGVPTRKRVSQRIFANKMPWKSVQRNMARTSYARYRNNVRVTYIVGFQLSSILCQKSGQRENKSYNARSHLEHSEVKLKKPR